MMASEAHRISIDPTDGSPPVLPAAPESGLVLAYVPEADADACGRHLLEFAYRWRDEGHRVVLADARAESPILHEVAGVENGEGLTDVVLHGTSLARVTLEIDDGVALVTAGTIVPDPDQVLAHPRWTTLVSEFRRQAGLFVVAVPGDADAERLESLATSVVRFGSAAELADPGVTSDPSGAAPSDPLQTASAAASKLASTGAGEPASAEAPEATSRLRAAPAGRMSRRAPAVRESAPPASRSRAGILLVVLLLVVGGALGAAFMGWIEIPGITPVDVDAMIGLSPLR